MKVVACYLCGKEVDDWVYSDSRRLAKICLSCAREMME